MLLKSLELQGYKTFAGRTLFEFADTITAIVGPNGSGKSNIADSLRWVLGEQSYRLLRGKKTVDMIFSGSDQRARSGMASATIMFDNRDGWLPIDFTEVAITRRAYRDGQNEYLINGQRVRLKDISDLLGKSGLSQRTYTIIGQGLVDAALSLKAEERRSLFEEAAGIGLYRSRKQEALRRLENTKRNLERVEDILSELHPRLRSLERQAKRAQEYKQVQSDLHILLREWYGYHWFLAQKELNEAREVVKREEKNLSVVRQKEQELEQKISRDRGQIQKLRTQLASWHQESAKLLSSREELTREIAVLSERMRSIANQLETAKSEDSRLRLLLEENRVRLDEANAKYMQIARDLEEARQKAKEASDAIEEKRAAIHALEEKTEQLETQRYRLKDELARFSTNQSEWKMQVERYREAITETQSELTKLNEERDNLTKQFEQSKDALEKASEEESRLEALLKREKKALDALVNDLKTLEEKITRKEKQLTKLKTQKDLLEQAENDLVDYAQGARVIMQYARKGKLSGSKGTLSSQLVIPEEYEIAIAAALGEYIDAVLLENREFSQDTLDVLKEESARGVLIPVSEIKPMGPVKLAQNDEGVVGLAKDLVTVPQELRRTIDLLLGQVIVVRDRGTANKVLKKLPNHARVVTMQGEVFHVSGPIIAGISGGRTKLSRPRQRMNIDKEIAKLTIEIEREQVALEERHKLISEKEIEVSTLSKAIVQAGEELRKARESHQRSILALDKLAQQGKWLRERIRNYNEEITTIEKKIQQTGGEIETAKRKLEELEEALREVKEERSLILLDEHLEQDSYWKAQVAFDEKSLMQIEALKKERKDKFAETQKLLEENKHRIESLNTSLQELEEKKAGLQQKEAEISGLLTTLQQKINPAEEELKALEDQQAHLLGVENNARKELSVAERRFSVAQLELTRKQEHLGNLKERIEEDFGLVDYEYVKDISGPVPLPFDGLVEQLNIVRQLPEGLDEQIKRLRHQLRRMRSINPDAQDEYEEVKKRFEFLTNQVADLRKAEADIREVINELDDLMEKAFKETFAAVAVEFKDIFTKLFGGGSAKLVLTDPDNLIETGIDIEARLPGRRTQGLSLLSGGERSLTAVSLIFALLRVSPTPFCVLDEVDAMLDETNVGRFRNLVKELSKETQFIIITHNRNTVQAADVIYGITMGSDSTSQVISLKMDEVEKMSFKR